MDSIMINCKAAVSVLLALVMLLLAACGGEKVSIPSAPSDPYMGNQGTGNAGNIAVSSITLNSTNKNLKYGESFMLVPTVRPFNATSSKVTFTVDTPTVCEILPSGNNCKVTAVGAGQAVVTATCAGFTATCQFTVSESGLVVEAEAIKIQGNVANIVVGTSREFSAVIAPANVTDNTMQWFSSNPQIATVDDAGVLTAHKTGTTILSVSTADGKVRDEVHLTIVAKEVNPGEDRVTRVDLNIYSVTLRVGETFQLEAIPLPLTAPERRVWYVSEHKTIISVSKTGLVTALSPGVGKITAGSEDGKKNVSRQCTITVLPAE